MHSHSPLFLGILLTLAISDGKAQSRIVSGVVTNHDDSRTLEGVAVSIKGTGKTSGTQADGVYYIHVQSADSILIFTLPGYETSEIKLAGNSEYNVALRSARKEQYHLAATASRCSGR